MVKLISAQTGPSWNTISKIELINRLNALGIDAELYGESRWPQPFCKHYLDLKKFKPKMGDIVINDGFHLESLFDLINLARYRYPHGRKKRLIQILSFVFKYIFLRISVLNIRCVFFNGPDHKSYRIYSSNIKTNSELKEKLALLALLNPEAIQEKQHQNQITIVEDIDESRRILDTIKKYEGYPITLSSAILSPVVFKNDIIPIMKIKQIKYIGFQHPDQWDHFVSESGGAVKCINSWKEFILNLGSSRP